MGFESKLARALDTVSESDSTEAYNGTNGNGHKNGSGEAIEALELIKRLRRQKESEMSVDERIQLALQRSQDAANAAHAAYEKSNDLELQIRNGFDQLNRSIQSMANGQSIEPEEPGSHIFDD